jgi:hypothetical protein
VFTIYNYDNLVNGGLSFHLINHWTCKYYCKPSFIYFCLKFEESVTKKMNSDLQFDYRKIHLIMY